MKYLLLIVLLVAVIITTGCVQPGPAKKVTSCGEKYRCNGICYPELGTCCGGIWYPVDNNNIRVCCGGKMVLYGKGTCCGGKYYSWPPYGTCCGGIFYTTPPDGTCCDGKWYVKGTPGECCPNPILINSNEGVSRFFTNGHEVPSWQNYTQVWINTDTQHCCAGKVAQGKGVDFVDCGEDTCIDKNTQSCCYVGYDKKGGDIFFKIRPGKESCCVDTPKLEGVDGKMYDCDPSRGTPIYPDSGEVIWDDWSRREMQQDVNRALGLRNWYV